MWHCGSQLHNQVIRPAAWMSETTVSHYMLCVVTQFHTSVDADDRLGPACFTYCSRLMTSDEQLSTPGQQPDVLLKLDNCFRGNTTVIPLCSVALHLWTLALVLRPSLKHRVMICLALFLIIQHWQTVTSGPRMLVALQHNSFVLQKTDRRGGKFTVRHTHWPWSDTPTLLHCWIWSECTSIHAIAGYWLHSPPMDRQLL